MQIQILLPQVSGETVSYGYANSFYLDLSDEFPATYSVQADNLDKLDTRASSFSKTIKFPSTENNIRAFGQLQYENSLFDEFDPRRKCKAFVWKDNGELFLEAWFRLNAIDREDMLRGGGKEQEFEGAIFSEESSLFQELDQKYLNELNLTGYNHTLTLNNVVASWNHTKDNLYTYPILNWNEENDQDTYTLGYDFRPAFFAQKLVEEIFYQNDYVVEIDEGITKVLSGMIIPYTDSRNFISEANEENYEWNVSGATPLTRNYVTSDFNDLFVQNAENVEFQGGVNQNNFDLVQDFGTVAADGEYFYSASTDWNLDITNINNGGNPIQAFGNSFNSFIRLRIYAVRTTADGDIIIPLINNQETVAIDNSQIVGNTTASNNGTVSTSGTFSLLQGDKVYAYVESSLALAFGYPTFQDPVLVGFDTSFSYGTNKNFSLTIRNSEYLQDSTIEVSAFLPRMKQSEFITDLQRLFNFYYVSTPETNHIKIISRDDFYAQGSIIDWSDKHDESLISKSEFHSKATAQNLILKMKDPSNNDELNERYLTKYDQQYGQRSVNFENDIAKATAENSLKHFSPTPFTLTKTGHTVSAIDSRDKSSNYRLLWKGENEPRDVDLYIKSFDNGLGYNTDTLYQSYPHTLHIDKLTASTVNLMYDRPQEVYTSSSVAITNRDFYNEYWINYINDLRTYRKLTAYFLLTANDVRNIERNKNTIVQVGSENYIVAKIVDFNMNAKDASITKVELIRYIGRRDNDFQIDYADIPVGFEFGIIGVPDVVQNGRNNTVIDPDNTGLILGDNNIITANGVSLNPLGGEYVYEDGQVILNAGLMIDECGNLITREYFISGGREQDEVNAGHTVPHLNQNVGIVDGGTERSGFNMARGTMTDPKCFDYTHNFISGGHEEDAAKIPVPKCDPRSRDFTP